MREPHPQALKTSHCFVFPYDAHFVKAYDGLLENISRAMKRSQIEPTVQNLDEYFSIDLIVELLVDQLRSEEWLGEYISETLFEDYDEILANDVIEELANFMNLKIYPYGLETIVSQIDRYMFLIEAVFDIDSEAIYYLFDDPEIQ